MLNTKTNWCLDWGLGCAGWEVFKGLPVPCDRLSTVSRVSSRAHVETDGIVYFFLTKSCQQHTHSLIPDRPPSPPPLSAVTLRRSSFLCKDKMRDYFRYTTDAHMLVLSIILNK